MNKILNTLLAFFILTASGCGYTTKSLLPAHLQQIHIPQITNNIDFTIEGRRTLYIPLLEVRIRNAVIDRYQFDGNLSISDEASADLILKAELRDYRRAELRATNDNTTEEFRIYITVDLTLWDTHKDEARWVEKGFTGEATFFTVGPRVTSEDAAIEEAIEDLARRIVERTIEDW